MFLAAIRMNRNERWLKNDLPEDKLAEILDFEEKIKKSPYVRYCL